MTTLLATRHGKAEAREAAAAVIQPHGILFALDPETLEITHVSANAADILGRPAKSLLGTHFAKYVDAGYASALGALAAGRARGAGPYGPLSLRGAAGEVSDWRAAAHRAGASIIVEAAPYLADGPELDSLPFDAATALRAIGENAGVGARAAAITRALRALTGYDRVLVLRFDGAGHGEVIAESRASAAGAPLAGLHVRAEEMSGAARAAALRSPIRMIVDVAAETVPVLSKAGAARKPLDLSEAILMAPPPGTVRLLSRLGARAGVLMTLAHAKRLWGFVVFLHRTPRRISMRHRSTLQLMADALAVRFAAAEELERERDLARRHRGLAAFERALEREPGDAIPAILRRHAKGLLRILGADGLWCHLPDADFGLGDLPPSDTTRRIAALCRMRSGSGVFVTDHVGALDPALAAAEGVAGGALFAVLPRTRGTILFLRKPAAAEDAAAGRDRVIAERSEAWRRAREGHSTPWSAADLAIAPGIVEAVDALAPRMAERRRMRRVLENEAKLQAILDATQDGLIVIDGAGTLLDFSGGAERLFGWTAQEIVGQPAERLIPEPLRAAHRTAIVRTSYDLRPRVIGADGKLVALRKDGSTFPLEMTLISIVLGGETMFVGALRDITDRLGVAQRDRFWFEHSSIGYSVSDPFTEKRIRVNPALCAMLGYREDELLALPVLATTHPDDVHAATAWREDVGGGSDEPLRRVQRLLRKDGKTVWARVTALPMRHAGSENVHVVAEIVDVTDVMEADSKLRAALARAEAASATKSQFLATMSHELRTPLNAIIGMSEMIAAEVLGPVANARYAEYVRDIHKAGRHLLDLVTDVLDTSRIEAGGYRLAPAPVSVGDVIEETHRIVAPLAAAREIAIDRRVALDLPALSADRRALKQVLINVVSNAIKFTPEKGLIAIRAAASGALGGIEITVADNGAGIAPEHLPHVIEPFYRAGDAYTTTPASGAGLGLSIAHGLVQAHGGSLDVTSQVGRGTTVTLRFPPPRATS